MQPGDPSLFVAFWTFTMQVQPSRKFATPVTLAAVKADPSFADWELVRQPRLSGKPVSPNQKPSIGCNIKWKPGNEPEHFK